MQINGDNPALQELINDANDPKRSTQELYQLIHHAYTYGADKCILVVGSNRKLMYVVEVSFPPSLLSAYDSVVRSMYEQYFAFFYDVTLEESSFPANKIKLALEQKNAGKKKGDQVSYHAFLTNYMLWRSLNVTPDVRSIKFPLPPMDRFLPCQNAEWNLSKGPSDTLTKLFDECEEHIPIRTAQTVAVARFLAVSMAAFHRSHQIMTSKRDVMSYKTLDGFRRAANNRASFKESLQQLSDFINHELEKLKEETTTTTTTARPPLQPIPSSPVQRRTRNTEMIPTQQWNSRVATGITPIKQPGRKSKDKQRKLESHRLRRENCLGIVPCVRKKAGRHRCELCNRPTAFYCSGCQSNLCFQFGKEMGDGKIKTLQNNLQIDDVPKLNRLMRYDKTTKTWKKMSLSIRAIT